VGSGFTAQSTATLLGDASKAGWFSTCIAIGTLATVPPTSQAADYWGRKWILVLAATISVVGSLVVSRSHTIGAAIAGFSLIGAGYGSQSLVYAVCSEVLPRKYRAYGQAAVNTSSGLGGILALFVGGALLRHGKADNFRIYWYVSAGFSGAGVLGIVFGYNPPPRDVQGSFTTREKLRRMDWAGIPLLILGLVLFSIGLQWSENPYSWDDPHVLAPFIVGTVLLIGFAIYEWLIKKDGLCNHELFGNRSFAISIALVFCEGLSFITTNSYLVFEITVVHHKDLLQAGFPFVVLFVLACFSSFAVGAYTTWMKRIREPLVLGFALLVTFNALMSVYSRHTPNANIWGYTVLAGIGLGFLLTDVYVAAQLSTPPTMISVASGLMTATRSLAGAIGLTINNAILSNTLSSAIPQEVAAAVLPLGFPPSGLAGLIAGLTSGNPQIIARIPHITPQIAAAGAQGLIDAYTKSFRYVWIAAACFAGLGLIRKFHTPIAGRIFTKLTHITSCIFHP
jgi:MFS family permease